MRLRSRLLTLCYLGVLGATVPLWAASEPSGDLTGYTGVYHESGATKAILGGSASKFVGNSKAEILADFAYVPFGYGGNEVQINGGVNVMMTRISRKVVPYVPLRVGFARYWNSGYSSNSPMFGGGLGVRAMLGRNWGVRPEVQYIRFQKSERGFNAMRLTMGVFYSFK